MRKIEQQESTTIIFEDDDDQTQVNAFKAGLEFVWWMVKAFNRREE